MRETIAMREIPGAQSGNLSENPYWPEWPQRSVKGVEDELDAWAFVEGFVKKICEQRRRGEKWQQHSMVSTNPRAKKS